MARGNLSRENEMCFNHALPGHRSHCQAWSLSLSLKVGTFCESDQGSVVLTLTLTPQAPRTVVHDQCTLTGNDWWQLSFYSKDWLKTLAGLLL